MSAIYDIKAQTIDGREISLAQFKGKALLVVNVASKCGFTPQYEGLEKLYETYKDRGFEVLAFPCNQFGAQEPGTAQDISQFCTVNYGVKFPLFAKVEVNGPGTHPLWAHLKKEEPGVLGTEAIKWNFTKFLIDRNGNVRERFAPSTKPEDLTTKVEQVL